MPGFDASSALPGGAEPPPPASRPVGSFTLRADPVSGIAGVLGRLVGPEDRDRFLDDKVPLAGGETLSLTLRVTTPSNALGALVAGRRDDVEAAVTQATAALDASEVVLDGCLEVRL